MHQIITMKTHLALLRGINVSGHNMIKMDVLKTLLENAGFQNVRTYIQSGNVFVDSEEEHGASVGFKIKQEIFKELGLEVPVVVISKEDLEKYGRTDVAFYKFDDENFFMDFSVNN